MQSAAFLRIGTRGSPLALAQATLVRRLLCAAHGVGESDIAIEVITTSGDRLKEAPLSEVGGKGLFSKEIEAALAEGTIDIGVHSSKDMATTLPDGLILPVFLTGVDWIRWWVIIAYDLAIVFLLFASRRAEIDQAPTPRSVKVLTVLALVLALVPIGIIPGFGAPVPM